MARLFDIDRNKIVPDATVLAVPSIKKLWDRDKSDAKETGFKEISYIVFLCDFHSPYRDIHESKRSGYIIQDLFPKNWKPDKAILSAVKTYKELQETPSMRLLYTAVRNLDKLSDYFDSIDFAEEDSMGKPKYSALDLTRNLKEVGNIVKSLSNLKNQVRLELENQSIRGDSEIGMLEDPDESDEIDEAFQNN